MKRGKTEVETLQLNGWGVGDILEGDEGYGPSRILITAMGEELFICRWDYKISGHYGSESGNTTLKCREWTKVGTLHPKEIVVKGDGVRPGFYYLPDLDTVALIYPDAQYEVFNYNRIIPYGHWQKGVFLNFKESRMYKVAEYIGEL